MTELKKILHVEDELDIQEITLMVLATLGGFVVKQCSSGREALEVAPDFMPDLFLLDVMMPCMSGPEMLKNLRKMPEFAQTPVIFMTAKAQADEIRAFLDMGAVSVVTKPFDPLTLNDEIMAGWRQSLKAA